jgi:hypothetical protein
MLLNYCEIKLKANYYFYYYYEISISGLNLKNSKHFGKETCYKEFLCTTQRKDVEYSGLLSQDIVHTSSCTIEGL